MPAAVIAAVLVLVAAGGFLAYTLLDLGAEDSPPTGDDASEVVFPETVGDYRLTTRTTTANPTDMSKDVPTAGYMTEHGDVFAVYAIPGVNAADLLRNFKVTDTSEVSGTTCGKLPDSADRTICATDSSPHGVGAFSVSGHSVEETAEFATAVAATIG